MRKLAHLSLSAMIAISLISCGSKTDEPKEVETPKPDNPIEALNNMATESQNAQQEAEKKLAERRAKGDTLAMPYAELMKYLPESLDGYKRGDPDGASMNMPGASYSTANVDFTNDKGERVKVTIVDYNQAYGLYTGATAMWAMGMSIDTPEEKAQGVKFDGNIAGWEQFRKKSGDATVTLGVGYRFWVQVEADGQKDTEWVKSVAKMVDLKTLSEM